MTKTLPNIEGSSSTILWWVKQRGANLALTFLLISFQDMNSNVNLHAELFLAIFQVKRVTDHSTKQLQKIVQLAWRQSLHLKS